MQDIAKNKLRRKYQRQSRVRSNISHHSARLRVSVHRSLRHMSAQIIDVASNGHVIVSVHDREIAEKIKGVERAKAAGKLLAEKALKAQVQNVVFDKGPYKYHGRVQAFADGMREGGLIF